MEKVKIEMTVDQASMVRTILESHRVHVESANEGDFGICPKGLLVSALTDVEEAFKSAIHRSLGVQ